MSEEIKTDEQRTKTDILSLLDRMTGTDQKARHPTVVKGTQAANEGETQMRSESNQHS